MRVKAIDVGWFNLTLQYPADPEIKGSEPDVFDIPDEPLHDQNRCKLCQADKKAKRGSKEEPRECQKVWPDGTPKPEAFSPAWMEQVSENTPISERNRRMTALGGELAFAAAAQPRSTGQLGQDMIDGRKVI